jgi:tRNA threonylcarbamoyladenosine biosynthesis protein TsaE
MHRPTRVTIETSDASATAALGERLGKTLEPGAVVALTGELGAGKTCFVQGLVRGLGVTLRATSPTFVLINEYRGRMPVHHVDLYRVDRRADIEDLGLSEIFGGDGVTLVEWAEKLGALLPHDAIRVHIEGVGDEPRHITIAGSVLA